MPLRRIAVREIMTSDIARATTDTPVSDLMRQITEHRGDCPPLVVVVDPDQRPLGVVTERDVVSKILAEEPPRGEYLRDIVSRWDMLTAHMGDRRKSQASIAQDLMTSPAVCVDEDASVAEVSGIMAAHGLRELPVLRGERVVGLVCRGHIVRAIAELYSAGSGPATEG